MKFVLILFLLFLFSTGSVGATSTATSVVETQIKGEGKVYTSAETTVNGQTVRKESNEPGKLELKMEQTGEDKPTISFSQKSTQITASPTRTSTSSSIFTPSLAPTETKSSPSSIAASIVDFVKNFLSGLSKDLTSWFE